MFQFLPEIIIIGVVAITIIFLPVDRWLKTTFNLYD